MKNKIFITLLIATLLLCVAPIATFASTSTSQVDATGSWEYESYGSGVILTEYLGSKADVYVPASIEADGNIYAVLKLADGIFENNDSINSITIGEGIIEIGARAFYDCDALVCILLPESLTTIGSEAFRSCDIFNSVILYDGVTSIGNSAFANCPKLTVWCNEETVAYKYVKANNLTFELLTTTTEPEIIELDNGMTFYVQNGSASLISYTGEATEVIVPATVNGYPVVGIYGAFKDNSTITKVILPEGIKTIGDASFDNCYNLENVNIPSSVTTIGSRAFYQCIRMGNVTIPEGVVHIGEFAFWYCKSITEITLPSTLKQTTFYVFGYTGLKKVVISEELEYIYACTFYGCNDLEEITIPSGVKGIGVNAFRECSSLNKVILFEGLESIESEAFVACDNLRMIVIPKSVSNIYYNSFLSTILLVYKDSYAEQFAIDNDKPYIIYDGSSNYEIYEDISGLVYLVANGEARLIDYTGEATEVVVPATVNGYPVVGIYGAFKDNSTITKVILPEGIKTIGDASFDNCYNLENVNIPSSVTTIGSRAFYQCIRMGNVTIPEGVVHIGEFAFWYCKSITEITLPSTLKQTTFYVFGYTGLKKVVISEELEYIYACTFYGCNDLEEITIPSGVKGIGVNAFRECSSLNKVILFEGLESIESEAFVACDNLRMIVIPKSVSNIYYNSFLSTILLVYKDSYAEQFAIDNSKPYHILQKTENPEVAYGASIEGTVIKSDSSAAAGATVEIYYADGTLKESVVTDSEGKYSFTYAEVGSYIIKATLDNGTASTTVRVARMNVFNVFIIGDTNITLKYSYTVSGSVNVSPAKVTITDTKGNVIATATTNDGSFSFAGIPNGEYIISAESENGFISSEITVFDGNLSGVNLTVVQAGVSIEGYVMVEDRKYNQYYKNWVDVTIYDANGNFVGNTKSDENGKYLFINLPIGEYVIVASVTEMRPDKDYGYDRPYDLYGYGYILVAEEGEHQVDTIILSEDRGKKATVEGKVTAKGQTQVSEIILEDVFGNEIAKFNTKSNGKYKFTNVSDGLYFVSVTTESKGMGYALILVRDGEVYGETNIKVEKVSKIAEREADFFGDIPELNSKEEAEQYRSRIAEEKRFYDSLSRKERDQLSSNYIETLNKYIELLVDCEYGAEGGASVNQGGLVVSGNELERGDDVSFIINVEKQDKWEGNANGVENETDYLYNSMNDKANGEIVEYYEITMFKTVDGKEMAITSVYKDTDSSGKFRITIVIPEEYRGHKHYSLVHVHCGEVVTLVDLDDDPNTITVEIDRFSTFGLTTSDTELIDESVTVDYDCSNSEDIPHTWADATCDAPKACSVCGKIEGEALGHNWVDATTEAPKTCSVCGKTEGDKLPETPGEDNPPIEDNAPDADEIPEEDNTDNEENCEKDHSECLENASGWKRFWNSIGNFFRSIFSKYVKCVCGDKLLRGEYAEFKKIFKQNK